MSRVDVDVRYSMLPEWILDFEQAGLDANAVRLYAILARYGNSEGGSIFPGRRRLADRMGVKKLDTVDKAARALVEAGAMEYESGKGRGTTNTYTLHSSPPQACLDGLARETGYPAERDTGVSRQTGHNRENLSTEKSSPNGEDGRTRPSDSVWDELVAWVGYEPRTKTERQGWNGVVRELKEAGATGESVKTAAGAYTKEWPDLERSPYALKKWWGKFLADGDGSNVRSAVLAWARNVGTQLEPAGLDDELLSWAKRGADDATLAEAKRIATTPIEKLAAGAAA